MGPRYLVRAAGLEMHPIDQADRTEYLKDSGNIGYCNITKCCTEVCPEHIKITDNAIIPLKERVADKYYDPLQMAWRFLRGGGGGSSTGRVELPVLQGQDAPTDETKRLNETLFPDLAAETTDASDGRAARGFVIRTDGAARGNPGPASLGAALFDLRRDDARDDKADPDASISDYLGVQTNNVAEYTGVVRALDLARELGAREVHLLLDSKLIVEQLTGRWRVKDAKLIPLWSSARRTLAGFDRWTAGHVPRAQNSVADRLANEAIDRAQAGGPASVVRRPGG